jgi:hypothetical protein
MLLRILSESMSAKDESRNECDRPKEFLEHQFNL